MRDQGKKVIFVSYWPNALLPIYEAMKQQGFNVHLVKPFRYLSLTKKLQPKWGHRVISKADLYATTQRERWLVPLEKTVFMIHGIGLEEAVKSDEKYKKIFVTGPKWMDEYKMLFSKDNWNKLAPVGFPILEKLLLADLKKRAKELREELSLGERPTILYGVFTETSPIRVHFISRVLLELSKTIDKLNLNLIVKPHKYVQRWGWRNKKYYNKKYEDLKRRLSLKPNIHIISPNEDILPYYNISDILVASKCSSIITEFMTLDKPVIQIVTRNSCSISIDEPSNKIDLSAIDNPNNMTDMEEYPIPYFPVGLRSEINKLLESVERCILNPDELAEERKMWVNKSVYDPVGTIKRAVEEIAESL
jgi:CDP-glycerol glycerophosphotransferase (TagB/SpsB family)